MNISFENKNFDYNVSKGFMALHKNRAIIYIATGLLGLYLPIFLYNLFGQNLQLLALYYIVGYFLYGATVAWGAKCLNKFGFRRSLKIATVFGFLYYALFYFTNANNFKILIPLIILSLLCYRLLYWIPYHVDFTKFTNKKSRGQEIGILGATRNAIAIFTPLLAGWLITKFSFNVLFLIAMALYALSIIPLFKIPKTREKFTWSIRETWQKFFSKKRRREVLAFTADGGEEVVGSIIWPIFMFQILKGDYLELGIISTMIIGVTVTLQLLVGRYADGKVKKEQLLHFGSSLYALGWIFKIFVATAFQIFVIDAYHKLMKIFMRIPFDVMTYEKAADEGHFVDEFTVIREMALGAGRIIMLTFVILSSCFIDIQWTFILGATAAILLNTIRAEKTI